MRGGRRNEPRVCSCLHQTTLLFHLANIELHGTSGETDDPITSILQFEKMHIQAFLKNGKISDGKTKLSLLRMYSCVLIVYLNRVSCVWEGTTDSR